MVPTRIMPLHSAGIRRHSRFHQRWWYGKHATTWDCGSGTRRRNPPVIACKPRLQSVRYCPYTVYNYSIVPSPRDATRKGHNHRRSAWKKQTH